MGVIVRKNINAIIIGEKEKNNDFYTVKNLLEGNQKEVDIKELLKIFDL